MANLSAKEALEEYQEKLGEEYGALFASALQLFYRISVQWDIYETLFGNEQRVELLNKTSGTFWNTIQNMMFQQVILGLCRLTDSAGSNKGANISLKRLALTCEQKERDEVSQQIKAAETATESFKTLRNKNIAHNDLAFFQGNNVVGTRLTRQMVTKAIIAIHVVLNQISEKRMNSTLILPTLGDHHANNILLYLFEGNNALEKESLERNVVEISQRKAYPDWLLSDDDMFGRYGKPK